LALVHEKAESDIMKRRPRNPVKDRLVYWKLLLYAYGFIGMIESVTAFLIFKWHMSRYGFAQDQWLLTFDNFPTDPYTVEVVLEGQSVFFIVLVVLQIGNLFTTRTRMVPTLPIPYRLKQFVLEDNWFNRMCNWSPACLCLRKSKHLPVPYSQQDQHENKDQHDHKDYVEEEQEDENALEGGSLVEKFQRGSRNIYVFGACVASILCAVFFTEIKACQDTFLTRHVEARYWFVSVCFAVILFFLGEMRKWIVFLWPRSIIAKLAW